MTEDEKLAQLTFDDPGQALEHAKAALAGDSEGVRLWMLDCGELVAKHRARADTAEASLAAVVLRLEGPRQLTDAEIEFLNARLDEDETMAKAAALRFPGPWQQAQAPDSPLPAAVSLYDANDESLAVTRGNYAAAHIARHDPARVLREVEVWRGMLLDFHMPPAAGVGIPALPGDLPTPRELHAKELGFRLALLAALKAKIATYSDHPDYRQEWKP